LPLGTYAGRGTQVSVSSQDDMLIISGQDGVRLCSHRIAQGKGLKIFNTDHKRDKSSGIDELIQYIAQLTLIADQTTAWLKLIHTAKPRYVRDQLLMIRKAIENTDRDLVTRTIQYCFENNITSASDFSAIIKQHQLTTENNDQKMRALNPLSGTHLNNAVLEPRKSSIADYQEIIQKSSK
jgi:hypothetical protein